MQANNRINIFNAVHKSLRALLYQTALQIQQTDFITDDDALQTVHEVETVVSIFEGHAHHEDPLFYPQLTLTTKASASNLKPSTKKMSAFRKCC